MWGEAVMWNKENVKMFLKNKMDVYRDVCSSLAFSLFTYFICYYTLLRENPAAARVVSRLDARVPGNASSFGRYPLRLTAAAARVS